jgi:hypothetical protein
MALRAHHESLNIFTPARPISDCQRPMFSAGFEYSPRRNAAGNAAEPVVVIIVIEGEAGGASGPFT